MISEACVEVLSASLHVIVWNLPKLRSCAIMAMGGSILKRVIRLQDVVLKS